MTTPDSSSQPAQPATSPLANPSPTPTPLPVRGPAGDVYVLFTRELAEQLCDTYTFPVQLKLQQIGNEWTAVARQHVCSPGPSLLAADDCDGLGCSCCAQLEYLRAATPPVPPGLVRLIVNLTPDAAAALAAAGAHAGLQLTDVVNYAVLEYRARQRRPSPCAGGCSNPAAHAEGAHDV